MMKCILSLILFTSMTLSAQDPCSMVEKKVDDFTDEVTISSPVSGFIGSTIYKRPVVLVKNIKKNLTIHVLLLIAYATDYNPNQKGVYIIFNDGTKFSETKSIIDVKDHKRGYEYIAAIPLTASEVKMFSTKQINRFRLYLHEGEIDNEDSKIVMDAAKCMVEAK